MAIKQDRKRQARGEARIKGLLEAAEIVFARDGYNNATTNEISATAAVSPATLYQFFSNKEAIANALAISYSERMAALLDEMDPESIGEMPADKIVSALIDPLLAFHKSHPAFLALLVDAPLSQETLAAKHALTKGTIKRLSSIFRVKNPKLDQAEADWAAEATMIMYKGFMPHIKTSTGGQKDQMVDTLKSILSAYLVPVLQASPKRRRG
jgi:AcrR family transcriptional regulator